MPAPTFSDLDQRRAALPIRLSRAELCRRAGISESTMNKGLKDNRRPSIAVRKQIELALAMAEKMAQAEGAGL